MVGAFGPYSGRCWRGYKDSLPFGGKSALLIGRRERAWREQLSPQLPLPLPLPQFDPEEPF